MKETINIILAYDLCHIGVTPVESLLAQVANYNYQKTCSLTELCQKMQVKKPDLILLDLSQTNINRVATLISMEFEAKDVPIIVISESENEEFALQLVRQGAQDHLGADSLSLVRLKKTINLAIERKALQNRLEFYMNNFEASNKELENFAYVASHDLQEPLRKIINFGNRLTDKCTDQLNEQGLDYVDRMTNAASRMKILLNDLLQYSRAGLDADKEEIDLNKLVENIKDSLSQVIEDKNAQIECDILPTIIANPLQMQQLFQNLISNAIKYSKPDQSPILKIKYTKLETEHSISFIDNGIGFDNNYATQVFDQFFRLHGKSSSYEGTGIGLAICKKIIDKAGGSINAQSKEGVGSTFTIRLPVKELARL